MIVNVRLAHRGPRVGNALAEVALQRISDLLIDIKEITHEGEHRFE